MAKKLIIMSIFTLFTTGAFSQSMRKAKAYFESGNFGEAKNEYNVIIKKQPNNLKALIYLGYISLLQNKLSEAEGWLLQANKIKPNNITVNGFLAEIHYRRNDFNKASTYFNAIGRSSMALKLARFKDEKPYQVDEPFDEVSIEFIVTNPIPFVRVKINGTHEGNFILDTGGGELILDETFFREIGGETFGKPESGDFGGGKKAGVAHGKIFSVQLGNLTVKNIPVQLLRLQHIELAGMKIDGAIGTIFLSQFLSTIDYKDGELVLRNKKKYNLNQLIEKNVNPSLIPFSMADDHFMLAKGSINNSDSLLFFIDTGLTMAFTCPQSTIKKVKVPLQQHNKATEQGGGGDYDTVPFDIEKLCLGNVCVSNLHGQYGPFPPSLEHSFGFKIDGLLSHEFFLNKSLTIDFERMTFLVGH
jgi:tetratricopeptide (TPR) repeat protein